MGVGILVPVDPMAFLIVAFVVIVGGMCCALLGSGSSDETSSNNSYNSSNNNYRPTYKGNMNNVVHCSCGFTYNKRNRERCPNCGKKAR